MEHSWVRFSSSLWPPYIFQLWFLSSFFLFFLACSLKSQIGCLSYFHTCLNANLECGCGSEISCTQFTVNTGCKKLPKNSHLCIIAQLCRAISLQLRHIFINNRKKFVKQQYLADMSSQYGELQPTSGWDRSSSLGHPSKFQALLRLGFVTAAMSLNGGHANFARCLAVSCIYIFGGSCPLTEFCQV